MDEAFHAEFDVFVFAFIRTKTYLAGKLDPSNLQVENKYMNLSHSKTRSTIKFADTRF